MKVEYDEDGNYKLKIILVGESGVGKTNLINIMQGKDFDKHEETTSSCSYFMTEVIIENIHFNIYLWDTIGQERLRAQTKIFFKNSKIVILVYDITNRFSFTNLEEWNKLVKENLGDDIVLGVLGNKKDLFMQEKVNEEEAESYANSINAKWSLGSAKTERQGFIDYIGELIRIYIKQANITSENKEELERQESIKLDSALQNIEKKKKCCK